MEGFIIPIFIVVAVYGEDEPIISLVRRMVNKSISVVLSIFLLTVGVGIFCITAYCFANNNSGSSLCDLLIGISGNLICSIVTVVFVKYYFDKVDIEERRQREFDKIMRFNRVVQILRGAYVRYFNCVVTPIDRRNELEVNKIRKGYQFDDLRDLYKPTLSLVDSFSVPSVERFFQAEEALRDYLLSMVANVNFDYYPELREIILPFAQISLLFDMRYGIIENKNMMIGEKRYFEIISENIVQNKEKHWVEKYDKKELKANLMIPYVALYKMLQEEEKYLDRYDVFIDEHTKK